MSQIKLKVKAGSHYAKLAGGVLGEQVVDFENNSGELNGAKADLWSSLIELNGEPGSWRASWTDAATDQASNIDIVECNIIQIKQQQ